MSEQKFKPGTHVTKVSKWGLRETKSGGAQVWIRFANGAHYFQTLNDNEESKQYLSEALVLCGFKGDKLSKFLNKDALDTKRNVELYIQYKPNSQTGEPQMQVNISNPNRGISNDMEKKDAMSKLKELAIDLSGSLKEAKESIGELPVVEDVKEDVADTKMEETKPEDDDNIPF